MVRPLRLEFSGALYHVTSRGDRQEEIYEDDDDREKFLEILSSVVSDYNWRCHAYCLMSNHYHLIIETLDGNLSKGMRQLNGVFTQASNHRHQRCGHLFQGRYKAILIDKLQSDPYRQYQPDRYAVSGYTTSRWRYQVLPGAAGKAASPLGLWQDERVDPAQGLSMEP